VGSLFTYLSHRVNLEIQEQFSHVAINSPNNPNPPGKEKKKRLSPTITHIQEKSGEKSNKRSTTGIATAQPAKKKPKIEGNK